MTDDDVFDMPGPPEPRPSRQFRASWDGECARCGWDFGEGDWIMMLDGEPIHSDLEGTCLP